MKSVVITGAGSGIGRACALRLAADGYRVTVNDLRAEAGEAVAAEIKAKGGTAIAAAGDVSSEGDVETIVGASRAAFGDPTHLVTMRGSFSKPCSSTSRPPISTGCLRCTCAASS
jgi:3-oxoacyl-[acyl-carrier protein] reductase